MNCKKYFLGVSLQGFYGRTPIPPYHWNHSKCFPTFYTSFKNKCSMMDSLSKSAKCDNRRQKSKHYNEQRWRSAADWACTVASVREALADEFVMVIVVELVAFVLVLVPPTRTHHTLLAVAVVRGKNFDDGFSAKGRFPIHPCVTRVEVSRCGAVGGHRRKLCASRVFLGIALVTQNALVTEHAGNQTEKNGSDDSEGLHHVYLHLHHEQLQWFIQLLPVRQWNPLNC